MGIQMEIIVRGRHFTVPERFRQHATAKLARLEKLDAKAVRIDVEVSEERNPRQSDHRERVELTIRSRGPAIRAEAAADDRYTALDLAFAKLESRLRRASDRRKVKHGDNVTVRSPDLLTGVAPVLAGAFGELEPAGWRRSDPRLRASGARRAGRWTGARVRVKPCSGALPAVSPAMLTGTRLGTSRRGTDRKSVG